MDYKALAQETALEILGYNQDTTGWKVVKTSLIYFWIFIPL